MGLALRIGYNCDQSNYRHSFYIFIPRIVILLSRIPKTFSDTHKEDIEMAWRSSPTSNFFTPGTISRFATFPHPFHHQRLQDL